MPVQPHLLLLQKTMVMVEGVATGLDPDINMWEVAAPFVREWLRGELGPEAAIAEHLQRHVGLLRRLPGLIERIEAAFPIPGAAPPPPPFAAVEVVRIGSGWRTAAVALASAVVGALLIWWF